MCEHNLKLHSYILGKWQEQDAASQLSYVQIILLLLGCNSPVSGHGLMFFMFPNMWCFMERGCQPFTHSTTWRTSPSYLWLPETRWTSYTARQWVARDLGGTRFSTHSNWAVSVHIIAVNHFYSRHNKPLSTLQCDCFQHTTNSSCAATRIQTLVQKSALLICFFAAHRILTAFIWLVGHLNSSSTRPNLPAKECSQ
jgi:hypothetical protein